MAKTSHTPIWLIGGVSAWLAYALALSALHLALKDRLGPLEIYNFTPSEPVSLPHVLLIVMVAPGFLFLDALSFFHIQVPWLDAAIYNWGRMTLLSSLPALLVGALLTARDSRLKLAGSILGLLLLGDCLLFVLNKLLLR